MTSTPIIRPPHAITIWADKEILYAELPQADSGGGQSHIVKLPLNTYGLTQALSILKARSEASRIGERGDPTQFQTNRDLAALAKGFDPTLIKRPQPKVTADPETRSRARDVIRRIFG